jgi:hypothetical protein
VFLPSHPHHFPAAYREWIGKQPICLLYRQNSIFLLMPMLLQNRFGMQPLN